jgi:TonB-dependent receptor
MKEKRRVVYSASVRSAPSFTQQTPLREAHRFHPLLSFGYQEVFNVAGEERNLGVSVNLFNAENVTSVFRTNRDFQNTTTTPAYVWDYRTMEIYNNRKQLSANAKIDYRLSPTTKLTFNMIGGDTSEPYERRYETRAFAAQTVGTTGNAGILPGYSNRVTQVRAAPGSTIDVTESFLGFFQRVRSVSLGAEHELERFQIDYSANISRSNINAASYRGDSGILINRITNVGWILDRTQSDLYPRFLQTEGPDFTNPANYRPAANGLSNRNNAINQSAKEVRGNVRYKLPTQITVFVKTGFQLREQHLEQVGADRRWNYIGTTALPSDPSIQLHDTRKTGRRIPQWEVAAFLREFNPNPADLWREDVYFRESTKYTSSNQVTETVSAGYIMAQGKLAREGLLSHTGFLTGLRVEKTETEGSGWVRARFGSTIAQQLADPIGSAQRDYSNTRRVTAGSYSQSFPSAHLTQDLNPNLKARLSWSTSYGRPSMVNFVPNETVNESDQNLTINNPSLKPQTATNWDATLDYYFEPVGNLSVGWFRKEIKDYIVSGISQGTVVTGESNGYNGDYAGFNLLSSANAGTAYVQGWELSFQQQLTFLPGLLKGIGVSANYTLLDTHGDFGGRANLSTGQVAGFVPRSGNVSLSWRYRGFSTQLLVNYRGSHITTYSAATPARNMYEMKRTIVNLGLAYQLRPAVTLNCDVANLFNETQSAYRGIPDQMARILIGGTTITFGVSGRF